MEGGNVFYSIIVCCQLVNLISAREVLLFKSAFKLKKGHTL